MKKEEVELTNEAQAGSKGREMVEVACAFCQGKGRDPFDIMSDQSRCAVCGGKGRRYLIEPVATCAFCQGTGIYPHSRLTCTCCGGVGQVSVPVGAVTCPHCRGTGRAGVDSAYIRPESPFYCFHCRGTGLISVK